MNQIEFNLTVVEILESLSLEIGRLYGRETCAYDLTATRAKLEQLALYARVEYSEQD